jgi:hypothetical protein
MLWTDFVVTGVAGGFTLMFTSNDPNAPHLSNVTLWGIGALLFFSGGLLPVLASRAYHKETGDKETGDVKSWWAVIAINALGYVVMLLALSLGANIRV